MATQVIARERLGTLEKIGQGVSTDNTGWSTSGGKLRVRAYLRAANVTVPQWLSLV